ncbi:ATP-binding cassette domain-containing protein [Agrococcus sp. Marseille-Q4369]|uniref:ABC transporter ATP-binding protein n=1 Tax=Agrococcus sp. Marseille-Q4369 TaxID=2810513 RepID=UPI001B8B3D61|nr:ATP-binding cassette domain-containing protein [Agrococcus sp. Marseille-Q4369]QUW17629.1 ATP-binding cassette domain-containing protein [Agrococcus sp. Marseille-Q4369]
MRPAIEVAMLRRSFGGRAVLDGVTFHVPWGSVTGFIGVNGAGKTTTLHCLLGLERGEGSARIDGAAYGALREPLRTVGFCPDALGAAAGASARAHLLPIALRAAVAPDAIDRMLGAVGLAGARGPVRSFSLGMRRRLAIAGALLASPRILVLDEPFDGLDPAGRRWLSALLRAHADGGGAVLLSAHALDEIEPLLDRLVCLHDGRTRFEGDADAFLRRHAAPVVIVRSPEPERLGAALRAAGAVVHGRPSGALAARGLDAERVARIAAREGVLVTELSPRRLSLSAAFAAAIEEGG